MKKRKASATSEPGPRLHHVNQYLEKNFPDFFAEARFQVGNDDYFLYSRFGQYLARSIESRRTPRDKIYRAFTVLNKMARISARDPAVRRMLVTGPLEHLDDVPPEPFRTRSETLPGRPDRATEAARRRGRAP